MIPAILQNHRTYERYNEVVASRLGMPVRHWPLNELAGSVASDISGNGNHGTVSGTTYYNQVTVSGTLNPDATGTYTVAGIYDSRPYYSLGGRSIWCRPSLDKRWLITSAPGIVEGNRWWSAANEVLIQGYAPVGSYTGTATVANVTESGVYTFIPSGITYGAVGPLINGVQTRGMGFDGSAGYVTTGINGDTLSSIFSISCWFSSAANASSATPAAQLRCVVIHRASSASACSFGLLYSSGNKLSVFDDSAAHVLIGSSAVQLNTMYHGVLTVAGSVMTMYQNGASIGTRNDAVITPAALPIIIGSVIPIGANKPWNGSLSDIRIYPRALTATEVQFLYLAALNGV